MQPGAEDSIETELFGANHFEVIRELGAGGMGRVLLARERTTGRLVAIKQVAKTLKLVPGARDRFNDEIAATMRVCHPNVIQAIGVTTREGEECLVVEFVEGGTLSQRMKGRPFAINPSLKLLHDISKGLSAIHQAGIVHRDLKPENIFLTKDGEAKIGDLGVAGLGRNATLTQAGSLVGSAKYVAPEFLETGECDRRGDIYALGVMAFELVTGQSPFRASNIRALIAERFQIDVRAEIARTQVKLPNELVDFISKLMSVNVVARYQSAEEVVTDIEALTQKLGASSGW